MCRRWEDLLQILTWAMALANEKLQEDMTDEEEQKRVVLQKGPSPKVQTYPLC